MPNVTYKIVLSVGCLIVYRLWTCIYLFYKLFLDNFETIHVKLYKVYNNMLEILIKTRTGLSLHYHTVESATYFFRL